MKKKSSSKSGFTNVRNLGAVLLCAAGVTLAMFSFASTPSSATLTPTSGPINYMAGPLVTNATPIPEVDLGPECNNPVQPCDDFALTVTLPPGYTTTFPTASIKVTMSWNDAGSGNSDYDLYVYKNPRNDCSPNNYARYRWDTAGRLPIGQRANPEVSAIGTLADGTQKVHRGGGALHGYRRKRVTVKIELLPGAGGGGGGSGGFGGSDPTVPGNPRYQNFYAPPGSAKPVSGEFNIGFSPVYSSHFYDEPRSRLAPDSA